MVQKLKLLLPLRSGEGTCKLICCFFIQVFMDEFLFTCIYNHFTHSKADSWFLLAVLFQLSLVLCCHFFSINVSNQPLFKTFFWWIYPKWISVWYFVSACRRFDYPQPTFQKLMKENCMEPFFVFQVSFTFLVHGSYSYFFFLLAIIALSTVFLPFAGFLCGSLVLGWVLVLQCVHTVHAFHVRVNNGKSPAENINRPETC